MKKIYMRLETYQALNIANKTAKEQLVYCDGIKHPVEKPISQLDNTVKKMEV